MPRPRRATSNVTPKYTTDPFANLDIDLGSEAEKEAAEEVSDDASSVHISDEEEEDDDEEEEDEDEDEEGYEDGDDEFSDVGTPSLRRRRGPGKSKKGAGLPGAIDGTTYEITPDGTRVPKKYKRQKPVLRAPSTSKRPSTNAAHFSTLKAKKRSRITSTFTTNTKRLVEGLQTRDRWIDLPLVPERRRLLSRNYQNKFAGEFFDVSRQVMEEIQDEAEMRAYFPAHFDRTLKVIMGTQEAPTSLNFPSFGTHSLGASLPDKEGWMLNVGGEASSMAWVAGPKVEGEEIWTQYLIVGVRPVGGSVAFPVDGIKKGGKTSLQIWRFQANATDGRMVCTEGAATIVALICGEWGGTLDVRVMPGEDCRPDNKAVLGVLGEDGNMYIMEVPLPTLESTDTSAYKIVQPASIIPRPPPHGPDNPQPYFSCFSFASRKTLHLGLSNGYISSFSIPVTIPIPTFYHPQHESCILSVASINEKMCAATSTSGFHSLFDFVHPYNPITSLRSRITCPVSYYLRSVNSVVVTDEANTLRALPIPRFQGGVLVAKHPHSASIRDVAVSDRHTFVCSAGWEGNAIISNTVRRLFQGKVRTWQVIWFKLLWKDGVLRVWEGFRPEEVMKRDSEKGGDEGDIIIWEDESALVSTEWNQASDSVAGWCAAGSVCGLVRVEDLALNTEVPRNLE